MSAEPPPAAPPRRTHWIVWLFASVGLLGILAFVLLVVLIAGPSDRSQRGRVAGKQAEQSFTVGGVEPVTGTDLVRMEVAASEGRGSYSRRDVRNILLLNRRTGVDRRILPDNSRRISRWRLLPAQGQPGAAGAEEEKGGARDEDIPAAYYLLQVGQAEGKLEDVLVGRLADGAQAYVMTGIDGVDASWMESPTRLGLMVRQRLGLYYRAVDMATLRTVVNRRVAIE